MKVLMMIRTSREGGLLRFAGISLVQYLGGGEAQTQSPLSSQEGSLPGIVTLSHKNGQRNKEHSACNLKCPSIDLI